MATSPAVTTVRNLVRKAKAISPTWGYFGLRADVEGRVLKSTTDCPVCKTCFKPVSSKVVVRRDHHPELYSEVAPHIPKTSRAKTLVVSNHVILVMLTTDLVADHSAYIAHCKIL